MERRFISCGAGEYLIGLKAWWYLTGEDNYKLDVNQILGRKIGLLFHPCELFSLVLWCLPWNISIGLLTSQVPPGETFRFYKNLLNFFSLPICFPLKQQPLTTARKKQVSALTASNFSWDILSLAAIETHISRGSDLFLYFLDWSITDRCLGWWHNPRRQKPQVGYGKWRTRYDQVRSEWRMHCTSFFLYFATSDTSTLCSSVWCKIWRHHSLNNQKLFPGPWAAHEANFCITQKSVLSSYLTTPEEEQRVLAMLFE